MVDSVSSRKTRHSTLFQGTGAPSQPNDESPLFADVQVELPEPTVAAMPLKAANVGSLFDICASQRVASSQPHHYAAFATGIRETPAIRCRVNYRHLSPAGFFSTFLAGPAWVALTGNREFHNGLGILSIDTTTGNCETFVHDGLCNGRRTIDSLYLETKDGVIMTGVARFDEAMSTIVSNVALPNNTSAWTQVFSKATFNWLHPLPLGDVIGVYTVSTEARVCRFQVKTGKILYDKPCSRTEVWGSCAGPQQPRVESLEPFYCDERTAVIGVVPEASANSIELYSIDFATGDSVKLGTTLLSKNLHKLGTGQILTIKPLAPSMTMGAKLSRWVRGEELDLTKKFVSEVLEFDASGAPQVMRPFELTSERANNASGNLILVSNKTHGVIAVESDEAQKIPPQLEFFEVTPECLKVTHTVSLEEQHDLRDNAQLAITRDNVVYVSTAPMAHKYTRYRLAAYDAESGECLWEVFDDFRWPPTVLVNSDDSISWLNNEHAVVFETKGAF